MSRIRISEPELKILFAKSHNQCAFPKCFNPVIAEENDEQKPLAEMAHMIAFNKQGPRSDPSISKIELNKAKNLILFCPTHHTLIDKFPNKFTIDVLKKMKDDHENYFDIKKFNYKQQNNNFIQKQIRSQKYIPDIFVETGELKEKLRFVLNPFLYIQKVVDKGKRINTDYFNKYVKFERDTDFQFQSKFKNYCLFEFKNNLNSMESMENTVSKIKVLLHEDLKVIEPFHNWDLMKDYFGKTDINYKLRSHAYQLKNILLGVLKDLKTLTDTIVLIVDSAGKGKTNLICDLVSKYINKLNFDSLVFLGSEFNITDNFGIEEHIIKILNLKCTFDEYLISINSNSERIKQVFTFIIDGINENNNLRVFATALEYLIEKTIKYPYLRIICTCRSEYFNERFSNLTQTSFESSIHIIDNEIVEKRTIKEMDRLFYGYLSHFNIDPTPIRSKVKDILSQDPLLLRFFCEAFGSIELKDKIILPQMFDIYRTEIFEKYMSKKSQSIANSLKSREIIDTENQGIRLFDSMILKISEYMIEHKIFLNIPIKAFESNKEQRDLMFLLLDEDVIFRKDIEIETGEETINFTFDEFRDHLLAKSILEKYKKKEIGNQALNLFLDDFKNSTSNQYYSAKEGVLKYIFLYGKETQEFDLETVLGNEGYRKLFIERIFTIKQEYISEDDIKIVRDLIEKDNRIDILQRLILNWRVQIYSKLNLALFLTWVNDFESKNIDLTFQVLVSKDNFIKILFNFCQDALNDLINESQHSVFDLMILLFGNPHNEIKSQAITIFITYLKKYPEKAILKLVHYIDNNDLSIVEISLGILLVASHYYPELCRNHVEKFLFVFNNENRKKMLHIIIRDFVKCILENLIKYNPELVTKAQKEQVEKLNQPISITHNKINTPVRNEQHSILGLIDYDMKKTYVKYLANNFGLHRCDAVDEMIPIIKNLGYDEKVYKSIEEELTRYRPPHIYTKPFTNKYIWQSYRILQGKWLDKKEYYCNKYDDWDINQELIDFIHRDFDPFSYYSPKKKVAFQIDPISFPKKINKKWVVEKRDLFKLFDSINEDWIILNAFFLNHNKNDKYESFIFIRTALIFNDLTYSFKLAMTNWENIDHRFNENRRNINLFWTELYKFRHKCIPIFNKQENWQNFETFPITCEIERGFELNRIAELDTNIDLLENDIILVLNLKETNEGYYSQSDEIIAKKYSWGSGYNDEGNIFIINRNYLENYLKIKKMNLYIQMTDERSIYSKELERNSIKNFKFVFPILKQNQHLDIVKTGKEIIVEYDMNSLNDIWKAFRLAELKCKNQNPIEQQQIIKSLNKKKAEIEHWKKQYAKIMEKLPKEFLNENKK